MRRFLLALLLAGCSCDEAPDLAGDGYVRCFMTPPPEGERTYGELRLRFEDRELTIEGLDEPVRIAIAAGPAPEEPPDADIAVILGDVGDLPSWRGGPLVLVVAGGADVWERWSGRGAEGGVIDATGLRRVRAGPLELVPVPGAPRRYASTDGSCGLDAADAEAWDLEPPPAGVTRVLVSWAAPEARGLLGLSAGSPVVEAIRRRVRATEVAFAWPREDPASMRPGEGPWIVRGDGSREPPGWTTFEARASGWARVEDSP